MFYKTKINMKGLNPFLATDGYKISHHQQYPQGTTMVYSNFTPRHGGHSNIPNSKGVISFGQQMVMKQIKEMFNENFFKVRIRSLYSTGKIKTSSNGEVITVEQHLQRLKDRVCQEIKKEYSTYLGADYDVSHIEALWDLGYLPIKVKALPEGTFVPYGVPVLTIVNTKPEFFWLTNFLETLLSNMLWLPMTSATTAHHYRGILEEAATKTDVKNVGFVDFQGHNFAMRGMAGVDAAMYAGLGHATSFLGDDGLPTIYGARKYYRELGGVVHSVNATEHSVMCAGGDQDELETFRYLMKQFPTGILSIVSDTWDLWKVITEYLPILKDEILARDGKIVIRPDSGDPVDIICGDAWRVQGCTDAVREKVGEGGIVYHYIDKKYYEVYTNTATGEPYFSEPNDVLPEQKGVVELLWDLFGGTVNEQGYKVLDPHIGAIYGDSITPQRAKDICDRLEAKGFASTNVVLGIGSFTYQYVTRDTHGFAMKATYVEVKNTDKMRGNYGLIEGREIFKDPITGDGSKKSAKGLLCVANGVDGYELIDQVPWTDRYPNEPSEDCGALQLIFEDGKFFNETTLTEIRERLKLCQK